jgi:glycosyltransferase involved in cell wall biosynthesis
MDEQTESINNIATIPLVSVIMSVHNGEAYLKKAIDSIYSQTYTHWELIIMDDCSNEITKSILALYSADPKIKIKTQLIQKGLTKNLNEAIELCNGEFIARMDADDICINTRLEEQINYLLRNNNTDALATFITLIDENDNPVGTWTDDRAATTHNKIKRLLPYRNCIAHPTIMIRKKVLAQYKYNDEQINSQDWDLWLRMTADNLIIEKINTPLLLYRIHSKSVTSISNTNSAYAKKQKIYKIYLKNIAAKKRFTPFNLNIRVAFWLNSLKLYLSKIKKITLSNNNDYAV